jgi:hypothetical protein
LICIKHRPLFHPVLPLMCINPTIGRAVIVDLYARTGTTAIKSLPSGDSPFQALPYP